MQCIQKVYNSFQKANPEKFNSNLISMREKEKEDLHSYFVDVFSSLRLSGIDYQFSETITDESEFHKYVKTEKVDIEESRYDLIRAKFELTSEAENERQTVWLNLFFPKIVNKYFFQLKGSTYNAVYQITDRNFYPDVSHNNISAVYLKSLLMPLGVHAMPREEIEYFNADKNEKENMHGYEFVLDFFRRKQTNTYKNMMYFFFVKFGIQGTIDKLFNGANGNYIEFVESESKEPETYDKGWNYIRIRDGLYLRFKNLNNTDSLEYRYLVSTFFFAFKNIRKNSAIDDADYWKKKILTSPTAKLDKADKAIYSLERVLDDRTKKNLLPELKDPELCEDVYGVIKWITYNFHSYLLSIDMVDLENRRLRLYEYMLYPLLRKLSDASYRILNSRRVTIKRLINVFSNIGPEYIVRNLLTNELFRYSNASSSMDFFQSLKFSACGPQAIGSGKATIKFKTVHPSYVGTIGLNTASATDPGLTGTICPMTDNIDNMQFGFHSDRKAYNTADEAFILHSFDGENNV
ncbi:hypothetical protein [Proteus mirabilis]|uniref:hypothetical protein n=1 Tax=Proteus mirabilis TaxID=584 RepID=UPI0034D4F7BA